MIERADGADLEFRASQVDPHEIDRPRSARISELAIRYARRQLTTCGRGYWSALYRRRTSNENRRRDAGQCSSPTTSECRDAVHAHPGEFRRHLWL